MVAIGVGRVQSWLNEKNGKILQRYWTNVCQACAPRGKFTTGKERRISHLEHEAVLAAVQARLDRYGEKMRLCRRIVEHPFGTMKLCMGGTHFQMKTLKNVRTEMALHRPGLQVKRAISIRAAAG